MSETTTETKQVAPETTEAPPNFSWFVVYKDGPSGAFVTATVNDEFKALELAERLGKEKADRFVYVALTVASCHSEVSVKIVEWQEDEPPSVENSCTFKRCQ
jgi:hypothetical protein